LTQPRSEGPKPEGATGAALATLGGTVAVVLAIDLLTKQLALTNLSDGSQVRLLGGALWFDLTRNSGAAFSIGAGFTWVFPLVAIVVMTAILYLSRRLRSMPWALSLGLILGGALGNFVDRLFRAPGPLQGHVVDFISVFGPAGERFPIFNAADSSLFCGVVLAILLEFSGRRRDGTRVQPGRQPDPAAAGSTAGVRDSHRDEA
jgi:signal peptidase II